MMNNQTDLTFSVSANLSPIYTATHFFSGVPIIKNIILKNIPECSCEHFSIVITARDITDEALSFRLDVPNFSKEDYLEENSDTAVINLENHKILPKTEFIRKITTTTSVRIQVSVTVGNSTATCIQNVKIYPFGHICPEMPPELLCTYVLPDSEFASKAEKALSEHSKKVAQRHSRTAPKPLLYAESLVSFMHSVKLTYSAIHRELLDGECIIRDPDKLIESNNRSVSLTQAALLYCSCAERCGLRPGIIYLRKGAGPVKVLVSIALGDYFAGSPVSESISELREKILNKELFVFDVLGFLGTEDTDFARNVTESTNLVLKSTSSLAFFVDVHASRLCGVRSLRPFNTATPKSNNNSNNISDTLKNIEKNASDVSLYGYSPYSFTSLGLCLAEGIPEFGKEYILCALDDDIICSNPDSFLTFSSFVPRNLSVQARSLTEQSVYETRLSRLSDKISACIVKNCIYTFPSKYILSGEKLYPEKIREEILSDALKLCEIVKADSIDSGNTLIYTAVGIIKFSENGQTYYSPCAYVPSTITLEEGTLKLNFGTGKIIYNKCLRDYVENLTGASFPVRENEILSGRPTDIIDEKNKISRDLKLCLAVYNHICTDYPDMFTFYGDCFVSAFNLSSSLMRECLGKADEKDFERYIEIGRYSPSEITISDTENLESTLPFELPSDVRTAVFSAENNSVIISGAHGTGKKKAVANIIARTALAGKNLLLSSKYSESIDSLYNTLNEGGLSELCLVIKDDNKTKEDILRDLDLFTKEPERPDNIFKSDADMAENELSVIARDMYSESHFGYSLYDCIQEYCKYELACTDSPIKLSLDVQNVSSESVKNLFNVSDKLIDKAQQISDLCSKGSVDISRYLKYIKNTRPIRQDISKLLVECASQLDVFAKKSSFARGCLGLSEPSTPNYETLLALGELLVLIMDSGIDFLPKDLADFDAEKIRQAIEKACETIDEINSINSLLSNASDNITEISPSELLKKWKDSENNLFVKNSIIHEIKKYLPPKTKLSSSDAITLLENLTKKEALETELASLTGKFGIGEDKTDTQRAKRISSFAISADECIKKLFANAREDAVAIYNGIASLVSSIINDKVANADFVLAMGAFKKLALGKNSLINILSESLCADFYKIEFNCGILSSDGLSKMLRDIGENTSPLSALHEFNILKNDALVFNLPEIVEYIETNPLQNNTCELARKSIYLALANYIIHSKMYPRHEVVENSYLDYRDFYTYGKQLARYNVVSAHRNAFRDYINKNEGKNELSLLRRSLTNASVSAYDILSMHSNIINVMYPAILTLNCCAYRLEKYPDTLILLDCEKTSAIEALPLCANFDKCIFISSPFERPDSIVSLLPAGLPTYKLTRVLCEKNGYIASFAESLYKGAVSCLTKDRNQNTVTFVKCPGGLYDKNVRANKIEAHMVCEIALNAVSNYGFDNVGIIALTKTQANEIMYGLELLANKYSDNRIANIPVRYIGNMGDLSKDCIIVSIAFGKSIYSITRSYGIADDTSQLYMGSPISLSELLCCKKQLYVVSSTEQEDIMTDNLCKGASAIALLICFAKNRAVPSEIANVTHNQTNYIENLLIKYMKNDNPSKVAKRHNRIITCGEYAQIMETGYIEDTYDRIILPLMEAETRGYKVKFSNITGLLKN